MRIAIRRLGALFTLLAALPASAIAGELPSAKFKLAALPPVAGIAVPALDHQKALAEDAVSAGKGVPLRYAVGAKVGATARDSRGKSNAGLWESLPDGRAISSDAQLLQSGCPKMETSRRSGSPTPSQIFCQTSAEVIGCFEKIVRPVSASG